MLRQLYSVSPLPQSNQLFSTTATVILELLGYEINNPTCRECPPWKIRLEVKIKEAQRDISWLTEVQKGVMTDRSCMNKKYNKMSISEARETARQRLTALAVNMAEGVHKINRGQVNK